jgi:hypothetical protein
MSKMNWRDGAGRGAITAVVAAMPIGHIENRCAERARALADSTSLFFIGAFV